MQPESPARIWEAREAASAICRFVEGRTFEEYSADFVLRSAVERQFIIVGEALNQLRRTDSDTAATVPDLPQIVAFRNVLVHGYAVVRDATVWDVAKNGLPELVVYLDELLRLADFSGG